MYLNTFLNTFLHTPLNINDRSSVDWSANHGFKHFNAVNYLLKQWRANEKRCTMPYSMSVYNVGVVTLFISAIINVTNLLVW